MKARLLAGGAGLLALLGIADILHAATDFPTESPVTRVDAELVAYLRAHPGLHRALADGAVIEVALALRDDADNRAFYGTSRDEREDVPRRAIHIQKKGERAAIHADLYNPRAGFGSAFLHGCLEVPVIPLGAAALLGLAFALWPRRRRGSQRTSEASPQPLR